MPTDSTARMKELILILNKANAAYYVANHPVMSDAEYDTKMDELVAIEEELEVQAEHSPTLRIGSDLSNDFDKVAHEYPVQSLRKLVDTDGLQKWLTAQDDIVEWIVQPKLDGLTLVLTYDEGVLIEAITRGDGTVGDSVIENARTMQSVPLNISYTNKLIVRGEVVVHDEDFAKFREEGYSSTRAFASGSLKNKDSQECARRPLQFYVFDVMNSEELNDDTFYNYRDNNMAQLAVLGFQIVGYYAYTKHETMIADADEAGRWATTRIELLFDTDGMVIKPMVKIEVLDSTRKAPKKSIAFKFKAKAQHTELLDVVWNTGKTGKLTPVAILSPVDFDGVTVGRASLHNAELITKMGLHESDTVILERANDVIPKVIGVVERKRLKDAKPIVLPTHCPACGSVTALKVNTLSCTNLECDAVKLARLHMLFDKVYDEKGKEIKGIAGSTLKEIFNFKSYTDLYSLLLLDALEVLTLGKSRSQLVYKMISRIRLKTWQQILRALNIDGVGNTASKAIAAEFSAYDLLRLESDAALQSLPKVNRTAAKNTFLWFRELYNIILIENLMVQGYNTVPIVPEDSGEDQAGKVLHDMRFCLTGTMSKKRRDIEALIVKNGGEITSVNKQLTYLVAGEAAGSKKVKAEKYGITVISEDDLYALMETIGAD